MLQGNIYDASEKLMGDVDFTGTAHSVWGQLMQAMYPESAFNMVLGCLLAGQHIVKSDGTFVEWVVDGECWGQSVVNE